MANVANGSAGQNSTILAPASAVVIYRPIGSDGEVLMRSPREPQSWNAATTAPAATRAAPRILLTLADRPTVMIDCSFLKIRDRRFLGRCGRSSFRGASTRGRDQMAVPNNDFMDDALHAVGLRRELALLNSAFDKEVVAFLEG